MKSNQYGFVLVSVLLITTIASVVALGAVSEARLQERIAGSQVKEINARALAERASFKGYEYIKEKNIEGLNNEQIAVNLNSYVQSLDSNMFIEQSSVSDKGLFSFVSKGSYQGAKAYLRVDIDMAPASGGGVFEEAVVGCDSVTLAGSGLVDKG